MRHLKRFPPAKINPRGATVLWDDRTSEDAFTLGLTAVILTSVFLGGTGGYFLAKRKFK